MPSHYKKYSAKITNAMCLQSLMALSHENDSKHLKKSTTQRE